MTMEQLADRNDAIRRMFEAGATVETIVVALDVKPTRLMTGADIVRNVVGADDGFGGA